MLQGGRRALWFQRALLLAMIPVVVVFTASLVQVHALYLLLTGFLIWACFTNEAAIAPPVPAKPATHELTNELLWVKNLVHSLARKANILTPDVCITHEADYNAAAKYQFKRRGTIYVHDAILYLLHFNAIPQAHIELSMAHEVGHLAHHDQLSITLYKVFYALYQVALLLSLGCFLGHTVLAMLHWDAILLQAAPVWTLVGSLLGYLYFGLGERFMNRNCEQLADDFSVRLTKISPKIGVHRFAQIREWDHCVDCMINPTRLSCDEYERWISLADLHIRENNPINPFLSLIHHVKFAAACGYYLSKGFHKTPYKKQIWMWLEEAAGRLNLSVGPTFGLHYSDAEPVTDFDKFKKQLDWLWTASHPTDEQRRQYMLDMENDAPVKTHRFRPQT